MSEQDKVKADLLIYGTGALFINNDGEARHIPLTDMYKSKAEMSEYKLVPIEPTQAMLDRGAAGQPGRGVKSLWIEMVDAAPSCPNDPYKALEAAREAIKAGIKSIYSIESIAFNIPAPNIYTPNIVHECCVFLEDLTRALRQIDEVMK